jgi:hypothetical protein
MPGREARAKCTPLTAVSRPLDPCKAASGKPAGLTGQSAACQPSNHHVNPTTFLIASSNA